MPKGTQGDGSDGSIVFLKTARASCGRPPSGTHNPGACCGRAALARRSIRQKTVANPGWRSKTAPTIPATPKHRCRACKASYPRLPHPILTENRSNLWLAAEDRLANSQDQNTVRSVWASCAARRSVHRNRSKPGLAVEDRPYNHRNNR